MDAVYPAAASALARGRRVRRAAPRLRHRTTPVTFAEIKEVDEDKEMGLEEVNRGSLASVASGVSATEERRRRPDLLGDRCNERLDREFTAFRRRRARRQPLREPDESPEAYEPPTEPADSRAASEPRTRLPIPPLPSDAP